MYIVGMPFLCLGSLGVAQSTTVLELMVWRIVQAMGAAGGGSIGPAVIGDIYKLEERGYVLWNATVSPSLTERAGPRWAFF